MPHHAEMIEHTLTVSTGDEAEAVRIAEMIARFTIGLSSETNASITTGIDRYLVHCAGDPEELEDEHDGAQP